MLCFEDDEDWKKEQGIDGEQSNDGESTIRLALSQKQEHLYTEYIEELRKLRINE